MLPRASLLPPAALCCPHLIQEVVENGEGSALVAIETVGGGKNSSEWRGAAGAMKVMEVEVVGVGATAATETKEMQRAVKRAVTARVEEARMRWGRVGREAATVRRGKVRGRNGSGGGGGDGGSGEVGGDKREGRKA